MGWIELLNGAGRTYPQSPRSGCSPIQFSPRWQQDKFNVLNVAAILFSLSAFISWMYALVDDKGVLSLEPYTRGKAAASIFILLASCCDMCRYVLVLSRWTNAQYTHTPI